MRASVLADFESELQLCERVALLLAAGYRRSEIARMLADETPAALRLAELRVKHACSRLDAGDSSEINGL